MASGQHVGPDRVGGSLGRIVPGLDPQFGLPDQLLGAQPGFLVLLADLEAEIVVEPAQGFAMGRQLESLFADGSCQPILIGMLL
ncbi:hypothetical protein GGE65_007212 [Skermanella aerolata]|uniref:hypothetical protein n=1 Tax=Skermanella aerolata TaxID=393310 RepID=UPI003D1EADD9